MKCRPPGLGSAVLALAQSRCFRRKSSAPAGRLPPGEDVLKLVRYSPSPGAPLPPNTSVSSRRREAAARPHLHPTHCQGVWSCQGQRGVRPSCGLLGISATRSRSLTSGHRKWGPDRGVQTSANVFFFFFFTKQDGFTFCPKSSRGTGHLPEGKKKESRNRGCPEVSRTPSLATNRGRRTETGVKQAATRQLSSGTSGQDRPPRCRWGRWSTDSPTWCRAVIQAWDVPRASRSQPGHDISSEPEPKRQEQAGTPAGGFLREQDKGKGRVPKTDLYRADARSGRECREEPREAVAGAPQKTDEGRRCTVTGARTLSRGTRLRSPG